MDLSNCLKKILKPILKNYSPILLILKRNWENIIGSKYYKYCQPEKCNFKKQLIDGNIKTIKYDGTLYIVCFNSVVSFFIENNKLYIIEKINIIFGRKLISQIKIKQNPKIIK